MSGRVGFIRSFFRFGRCAAWPATSWALAFLGKTWLATLARVEAQVVIEKLLTRFPGPALCRAALVPGVSRRHDRTGAQGPAQTFLPQCRAGAQTERRDGAGR